MSREKARASLEAVLRTDKWSDMGGLDEDTIYGDLAMDVAEHALRERQLEISRLTKALESIQDLGESNPYDDGPHIAAAALRNE